MTFSFQAMICSNKKQPCEVMKLITHQKQIDGWIHFLKSVSIDGYD